jgi:hypothetical protein
VPDPPKANRPLPQFLQQRFDPLTEERIKAMIAELEQRKEAMH